MWPSRRSTLTTNKKEWQPVDDQQQDASKYRLSGLARADGTFRSSQEVILHAAQNIKHTTVHGPRRDLHRKPSELFALELQRRQCSDPARGRQLAKLIRRRRRLWLAEKLSSARSSSGGCPLESEVDGTRTANRWPWANSLWQQCSAVYAPTDADSDGTLIAQLNSSAAALARDGLNFPEIVTFADIIRARGFLQKGKSAG